LLCEWLIFIPTTDEILTKHLAKVGLPFLTIGSHKPHNGAGGYRTRLFKVSALHNRQDSPEELKNPVQKCSGFFIFKEPVQI
jgi:hypothetical protein